MKEKYIKPEIEIVRFECEDVIATSDLSPVPDEDETPVMNLVDEFDNV